MTEEVKEAKVVEENTNKNDEPVFENYKQRQRYYDEKYKNRGDVFFAQRGSSELFANGRVGTIKRKKGRTYRKEEK